MCKKQIEFNKRIQELILALDKKQEIINNLEISIDNFDKDKEIEMRKKSFEIDSL